MLAWVFYKFLVKGRSPKVLERQVRGRIWWTVILIVAVTTTIQAAIFYGRGGTFGSGHVRTPWLIDRWLALKSCDVRAHVVRSPSPGPFPSPS